MKTPILPSLLIFLLIALVADIYCQTEDIFFGKKYTITSNILNENRQVAIYLPSEYENNNDRYQVVYLLDGEWHFHFVSSLAEKLASGGDIPKLIIVGIVNNNRSKDLTPAGTNDNTKRFGGAEEFLEFLRAELKPWVDSNFRTQPYTILAGHSFGGLFTIYSLMQNPGLFQAFIALSPSLGRNDEQQVRKAAQFFKTNKTPSTRLYIAVGNEGGATFFSTQKFTNILLQESPSDLDYTFEKLDENHVSITAQGFIKGLTYIYADFNPEKIGGLDEIFLVEDHYENLSKRFGYTIKVPETYFQQFTKEQIAERELDYALFILEKYRATYPNSLKSLAYLADVYLLKGDFNTAKKYYEQIKSLECSSDYIDTILKQIKP